MQHHTHRADLSASQNSRFGSATSRGSRLVGTVTAAVALLASLTACVAPPVYSESGTAYPSQTSYPVQSTQHGYATPARPVQMAEYGRVAQIDLVRTQEQPRASGAGAIIGGVAGAVLGRQIGGGFGRDAATAIGAVGGAVAGNSIEKNNNAPAVSQIYRVSIQLDNGSYRAFDVGNDIDLRVGDRVRIENGQIIRS